LDHGALVARLAKGSAEASRGAIEQTVGADHQQLSLIDVACHLAAYLASRVGAGQRCCWSLNADPLGGECQ
jgi:hypothetical protein